MYGIHDVFPPHTDSTEDPISPKKLIQTDGSWAVVKDILGLTFDGDTKTVWLDDKKRIALLMILINLLQSGKCKQFSIPFTQFRSVIAKIRHAFTTTPAGKGLLSPFNALLKKEPKQIYLHNNEVLRTALSECRTFLLPPGVSECTNVMFRTSHRMAQLHWHH